MILFLDYDGVLHPDAAYIEKGRPVLRAEGEFFMWAPLLVDILADHPHVRVVLSTSWVRILRFDRARQRLPAELARRVIGSTWHSTMARHPEGVHKIYPTWWDESTRYAQIKRYVDRAGLTRWLAIDDHDEGWAEEDRDCLIHTQSETGISTPDILAHLHTKLLMAADAGEGVKP